MAELWSAFQARSPYVSRRTVTEQRWNAEGLLRHKSENTREFAGLITTETPTGKSVDLLYKDSSRDEDWLPVGGGKYRNSVSGVTFVDRPVYEAGETEDGPTAEPTGIMTDRVPYFYYGPSDAVPPSVSMSLPSCREVDTCLMEAQREYAEAYADWEAAQVNNPPRRRYSVQFSGCLRLGLKVGLDYAGCRVREVTHSLSRNSMGTTVVLEHAL